MTIGYDFRVDLDIATAESLPPEAFTDPEFLNLELRNVFAYSWLMAPGEPLGDMSLADHVRGNGMRTSVEILGRPLLLQRDLEGTLRLFPNVCTHMGHTLVNSPECKHVIVCPQHCRVFDTTGACLAQPGFEQVSDFPRDRDHLRNLPVGEWPPFLFACLGRTPMAPLSELLNPVRQSLGTLPFDRLGRRTSDRRMLAGNWKLHIGNFMDGLHIPSIHGRPGGLKDALDLRSYRTELYNYATLQWAYARHPEHGFDPALLPESFRDGDRRVFALWWYIFPGLALSFYPWGLSVTIYEPISGRPEETLCHSYHYSWDDEKYSRRDVIWGMRTVDEEDVAAVAAVARGMRSGYAIRSRFGPTRERGPHWFQRLVFLKTREG